MHIRRHHRCYLPVVVARHLVMRRTAQGELPTGIEHENRRVERPRTSGISQNLHAQCASGTYAGTPTIPRQNLNNRFVKAATLECTGSICG